MRSRHLVVQILIAMIVLAMANVGIRALAANSVPRQLIRHGGRVEPASDVFLGNSTMAAGLDEGAFAAAWPGRCPLNLALGATSPVEHYLIYNSQVKHRDAAIYYGFLDTQLTDPPDGGWESLVGNRAMAYYADLDAAMSFYAVNSWSCAATLRLASLMPMLVERYAVWAKVEILRRALGEIGMPKKESNRFGRKEDFSLLESDPEEFAQRCERARANRIPLTGPINAIFQKAKENRVPIYVIEMPVTEQHRRRYYASREWIAYRTYLIELVEGSGGVYLSAADWIEDEGFADHLHMNAAGAREFSIRLAQLIRQKQ